MSLTSYRTAPPRIRVTAGATPGRGAYVGWQNGCVKAIAALYLRAGKWPKLAGMNDERQSRADPFNRALADWQGGRIEAALDGLRTAARGGDAGCAGLLLQLSADAAAPQGARAAAAGAVLAAPDLPALRRHAGFIRASGYGMATDPGAALALRIDQARSGDAQAMVEIALLSALDGGDDELAAIPLFEMAAAAGNPAAIAALLRLGVETAALSPIARRNAPLLARSGHALAEPLIAATHVLPDAPARPGHPGPAWPEADDLLAAILAPPPTPHSLHATPRVVRAPLFLPAVLCDYLTALAAPLLQPARVFDPASGQTRPDPYRQSLTAALPDGAMDLVSWAIKLRMARLAGGTYDQGEPLAVLLYRPGEQYRAHVDYLSEDGQAASLDLTRRGQRVATALVRLNQEFTGGDTVFPRLGLRWTGGRGDALSFANTAAGGQGDPMTLHAGEAVITGMKLLASLWLRERA
jgi:prolyl 4-hydroxylase